MKTVRAGGVCDVCGEKTFVDVRERAPDEDVINFTYHCGRMVGEAHIAKSPRCAGGTHGVMVPVSKNGIGYAGEPLDEKDKAEFKAACDRSKIGDQKPGESKE